MENKKNLLDLDTKVIIALVALLLVLVGALAAAFLLPPDVPTPVMPEGEVLVYIESENTASVYWPEMPEGSVCQVHTEGADVIQEESDHAVLSFQNPRQPLQLRFYACAEGKNLLGVKRKAESENYLEITVDLSQSQTRPDVTAKYQEADGALELSWKGLQDAHYEVYRMDKNAASTNGREACTLEQSVTGSTAKLYFLPSFSETGADGMLELPDRDRSVGFVVRQVEKKDGYTLYGPLSEPVRLERDSLLSGQLDLDCTETGERLYTLRWNETSGDYYEVQAWNKALNAWETVYQLDAGSEPVYETGRLGSGSDCRYQVTAYERTAAEPAVTAGPEEVSFRVSFSPLYATIWPLLDQTLYSSASSTSTALASIAGGTALCVLEEKDGYFYVRYQDNYGYVDSRFCMIDLAEYVGDLCEYNITNSYDSVFKIHDYSIDQITGKVIKGFENVRKADGAYLVPFLYPSAQKLIKAAEAAEKDGYTLKIYEAYRPNEATQFLYTTTLAQLDNPVPDQADEASAGAAVISNAAPEEEPVLPPEVTIDGGGGATEPTAESTEPSTAPPEPTASTEPETAAATEAPTAAPTVEPTEATVPVPEVLTLGKVMTDGRFRISSFLAASVSNHNRGVALDLTLETRDSRQELEMQSAIHDLSWYAATYRNNDNAKLLEKYMKDIGGMAGLTSEWWHFQDDEIKAELNLTGYLSKGVSSEGWKKDDTGWQYRRADGSVYRNTVISVDGKQYKINADGYAAE